MKITKDDLKEYWRFTRKGLGWALIFILMFSGFLRFTELNTSCGEIGDYYDFQKRYCTKSGFLNYKIRCELPQNEIKCIADFDYFSFVVVHSRGQESFNNDFLSNYSFNSSLYNS